MNLALIPHTAKNANGVKFEVKLNTHAVELEDMCNVDLKGTIKVFLPPLSCC